MRGGARAHLNDTRTVTLARPEGLAGSADAGLFALLEPVLFLVDGNNLLWRAAHGSPAPFTASDGRDITPLFRFFSQLRRALGSYGVFAECIVCFDGANAWASRLDIDAGYKSNRDYSARDVSFMGWLPEIRSALSGCGVRTVELEDEEADDVIATIASGVRGRAVRVYSTDRDYYQLLGDHVTVVDPRARPAVVDPRTLQARYGVRADQWCDFRALTGDPSDGIAGLDGVGPKRAAEMLSGGRLLEDLRGSVPAVAARWDDLTRWRELIRLRTDVPVGCAPDGRPSPKLPAPGLVCRELGLVS